MTANNIFVSYSSRDVEFAKALAEELEKLGSTVWIDQHGIGLGTNWDSSIDEALDSATTLLLLISKPGKRVFLQYKNFKKGNSRSFYIISTSKGILRDSDAIKKRVGGEVLLKVFT